MLLLTTKYCLRNLEWISKLMFFKIKITLNKLKNKTYKNLQYISWNRIYNKTNFKKYLNPKIMIVINRETL